MNRAILNLVIDTVAAGLLTALVATGYVLWIVLPPGTQRTHVLWGLLRHQWGTVHTWISVILLIALGVHVALHWRWLVMGLSKRFGLDAWAAHSARLAGLALVSAAGLPLVAFVLLAHLTVRPLDAPLHALEQETAGPAPDMAAPGVEVPSIAPDPMPAPTPEQPLVPGPDSRVDPGADREAAAAAVLAERCAACHGERRRAGGVRADTPEALRVPQAGTLWVIPGSPDGSPLLEVVGVPSPGHALLPVHRIDEGEVGILRDWILSLEK